MIISILIYAQGKRHDHVRVPFFDESGGRKEFSRVENDNRGACRLGPMSNLPVPARLHAETRSSYVVPCLHVAVCNYAALVIHLYFYNIPVILINATIQATHVWKIEQNSIQFFFFFNKRKTIIHHPEILPSKFKAECQDSAGKLAQSLQAFGPQQLYLLLLPLEMRYRRKLQVRRQKSAERWLLACSWHGQQRV